MIDCGEEDMVHRTPREKQFVITTVNCAINERCHDGSPLIPVRVVRIFAETSEHICPRISVRHWWPDRHVLDHTAPFTAHCTSTGAGNLGTGSDTAIAILSALRPISNDPRRT